MYGEKIRLIREIRGFSQENVAAKLGILQNAYSRIETNRSKLDSEMLVKIAGKDEEIKRLNVIIEKLLAKQ